MGVVMLLIARERKEHISLHGNEDEALEALIRYVDEHWADAKLPVKSTTLDAPLRIDTWIKATQSLYLIATPHIDSTIH